MRDEYSEQFTLYLTEEMKKRAEESDWSNQSEYFRRMILAGESAVAALDPRTTDGNGETEISNTDSVEEVAEALNDTVLLNELAEEPQSIQEILEQPTHEFQSILANRLDSLASNEASPVHRDPLEEGYYINTEE